MTRSDFVLTYALKAQTPMLHFQAQQPGATLRATEVKPKLDKFILQRLGKENIPKDWFLPDTDALNYKLRFRADGEGQVTEPHKMFFGNSGKHSGQPDYTWALQGDCTMTLLCFIPALRDTIDQLIVPFFICINFGRMQNKGFGGFTVANRSCTKAEIGKQLCKSTGAAACYAFAADRYTDRTFDAIQLLYTVMKAGFNRTNHASARPEQYHRSYLFEFFHSLQIGNEKAAMKKAGVSPAVQHPQNNRVTSEQDQDAYHYVRALLGIADHIEYITGFEWRANRQGREAFFPLKEKETVAIACPDVARFASPIFFKVIDGTVYIAANRVDPEILGKPFTFTNKTTGERITLTVPSQFDIDGFMAWFVERYNRDVRDISRDARNTYSIQKPITAVYTQQGGNANV